MEDTNKETTIRLFGTIGKDINGDQFARDLAALDGKYDKINIHINSPGGDVIQGYSIVSVILSMKTPVFVQVVGIAASMAAVSAICGKKVYMYDYSRLMIHDPYFSGVDTEKLSPKQKEVIGHITDSLQMILSRRGKDQKEIARLMKEETWFSSNQAKTAGLIDGIISTKWNNKYKELTTEKLLQKVSARFQPVHNHLKDKDMSLLNSLAPLLGLENPTEETVLNAVKELLKSQPANDIKSRLDVALRNRIIDESGYDSLLEMGNKAPEAFDNYLTRLETDHKEATAKNIDQFFFENQRKFLFAKFQDKAKLKEMAAKDFELFTQVVSILPDRMFLSEELKAATEGRTTGKTKASWTLEDYRKNAPEELKNNPQLYERLIAMEERK